MKLACLSFSEKGALLGERIKNLDGEYSVTHIENRKHNGGIKDYLKRNWTSFDGFIFISASGIAVRMINPYIKNKAIDPAIIVVDDYGKYAISLLSGHLGGANEIAIWISEHSNAIPVITTASDNRNIESIDMFAKKNSYYVEDMKSITKLTAMMVNGRKIGLFSEDNRIINYDNLSILRELDKMDGTLDGMIIVSSINDIKLQDMPYTILRPRNINIGIGCRKGIDKDIILEAIDIALKSKNLSSKSIKSLGTIEVKKDEQGIIETAKHYKCPLKIFTIEEIGRVDHMFEKSQFVKDTIGVYSVSEPSAYLLGGGLIVSKLKHKGVTISISKI